MIDFSNAITLLNSIAQTTKSLLGAKQEIKINEVAIQLQGIILDLQSEMMVIQSQYQ